MPSPDHAIAPLTPGTVNGPISSEAAPDARQTIANSFAFTSPYRGSWLEHFYRRNAQDLFSGKVKTERHLRELLAGHPEGVPELMIMGNFVRERQGIQSVCREHSINLVCGEDGFFPHYSSVSADPLGFCWESSLPQMVFKGITDRQRTIAQEARSEWLTFQRREIPSKIRVPYVLWPMQLIGDKVNRYDLNVSEWNPLITHFRALLPQECQLVLKPHPRARTYDRNCLVTPHLPNTCIVDSAIDLRSLIERSSGVVGANSSVLVEALLMFHKPTFAYARSWFTNHSDLICPLHMRQRAGEVMQIEMVANNALLRSDYLNDYADWFLFQLLARQLHHRDAGDWAKLREWTLRRSYHSYIKYGEDIFDLA